MSIVAVLVGRTVWKHLGGDPSAPPPIALRIESKPPAAEVWWDGFPSGKVTPVILAVDNGLPHALELRLAGWSRARITVPAGQPEGTIALELPEAGAVEVHSDPPGAMVSMKNEAPCITPCTVEVPAGSPAQLEMTRDGYLVETASFTVAGHSLARWTPRLRPSGTLEISSDPPSVVATVDGKPVGRTPLNVPVEAASPHQVAISLGELRSEVTVTVEKGASRRVDLHLEDREDRRIRGALHANASRLDGVRKRLRQMAGVQPSQLAAALAATRKREQLEGEVEQLEQRQQELEGELDTHRTELEEQVGAEAAH